MQKTRQAARSDQTGKTLSPRPTKNTIKNKKKGTITNKRKNRNTARSFVGQPQESSFDRSPFGTSFLTFSAGHACRKNLIKK